MGRIFVVIPFPGQSDPDSSGNIPDSMTPDELVQSSVDPHVNSSHSLLSEFLDDLYGSRSSLLQSVSMKLLMKVHCVFSGHDFIQGRSPSLFSLCLLGHL